MKHLKVLGGVLALLFVFGILGQFVGSFLFIKYGKIQNESLSMFTLYRAYVETNGAVFGLLAYKFSLLVSIVIAVIPASMIIYLAYSKEKRELHGSARFANDIEIQKSGLKNDKFEEPDILVGKHKGKYLRWEGDRFAYLAAPTRSGKGVGIVIPNCLHYRDSIVVFDPKYENFNITSGFRSAHGQDVFLFNPSASNPDVPESFRLKTHCWNPLSYISRDPLFSTGGAFKIANILFPSSGNESGNTKFFNEMAQKLFVGLCLYLIETESHTNKPTTLSEMLNLANPKSGVSLAEWIKSETVREDLILSDSCKNNLLSYSSTSSNTASGILASFQAPLAIFSDPVVAAMTSKNDFNVKDVRKKKMSIYIGIVPPDIDKFARLTNLFFSQLISENTTQLPRDNPELKYQCLLLIDELTALGKIEALEKGSGFIAGYNIRILAIFQNKSQVNVNYTVDGADSMFGNFDLQIIYPSKSQKDAQEYSEMIGYETYKSSSLSRAYGGMGNKSINVSDQKRPVLLPQEIRTMPETDCVVTFTGMQPIYAEKIIYYKDPTFISRINFPVPVIPQVIEESEVNRITLLEIANKNEIIDAIVKSMCSDDSEPAYIEEIRTAVTGTIEKYGVEYFKELI